MSPIDWLVLIFTLSFIVLYGMWKSRNTATIETYLLADRQLPWYHVGLSVMATQASAITFLSAPGQGYSDGLRFIQFYFGLPLAMIFLCIFFIPVFHKLKVYTAYEFLEKRFDLRTRKLTAFLFLLQRGLSTGITIYAPAIILSTILHLDIAFTILFNGFLVIAYTVYGGTKAVSYTQVLQMSIIFGGLILAAYMVVHLMPADIGLSEALQIAGKNGKLEAVDTHFDWNNRYNLWSGLIGGFFLQLSYFGTDQSQVGRYLTGSSIKQSRLGLLMNGLIKIPMQFLILGIGTLVFTFYQFQTAPLFFNEVALEQLEAKGSADFNLIKSQYAELSEKKKAHTLDFVNYLKTKNESGITVSREQFKSDKIAGDTIHHRIARLIKKELPLADSNDSNYIFLNFITHHLPKGIVGLLMAIIFLAAMGSTASGMNSLASTTVIDFYLPHLKKGLTDYQMLRASRRITLVWGLFCIVVAFFASKLGNLIEAVNILGSLFYGTILGIFMVAFFMKKVGGKAVFLSACITEVLIIIAWQIELTAFLWLNLFGCMILMGLAYVIQKFIGKKPTDSLPDQVPLS
jgi:Na+/proline symporter